MEELDEGWLVAELERRYELARQDERWQGGEAEELERAVTVVRRWLLEEEPVSEEVERWWRRRRRG